MRQPVEDGRQIAEKDELVRRRRHRHARRRHRRIQKLQEVSGGFGGLLGFAHEWANREKTFHSYELFARYVMPKFQDSLTWLDRSWDWTNANKEELMTGAKTAVFKAIADAGKADELPEDRRRQQRASSRRSGTRDGGDAACLRAARGWGEGAGGGGGAGELILP